MLHADSRMDKLGTYLQPFVWTRYDNRK